LSNPLSEPSDLLRTADLILRCPDMMATKDGVYVQMSGFKRAIARSVTGVGSCLSASGVSGHQGGCLAAKGTTLAVCLAAVTSLSALAAPPPGTDLTSPTHLWFEKQHNVRGQLCCDVSDGHLLDDRDVRMVNEAYEVRIEGVWFQVGPAEMRDPVRGGPNPTGRPVVWYTKTIMPLPGFVISCFAPGSLF
jgi:hypothetical protein